MLIFLNLAAKEKHWNYKADFIWNRNPLNTDRKSASVFPILCFNLLPTACH
ncbi:unnamed protein product [Ixodes pacificus]